MSLQPEVAIALVVLVAGYIFAAVVDLTAAVVWQAWYFRTGLCVYRTIADVTSSRGIQVPTEMLNARFASRNWTSTQFHELAPGDWAVRQIGSWWLPGLISGTMHGRLIVDPGNGKVTMLGYADWSAVWLVVVGALAIVVSRELVGLVFAGIAAIILLVSYAWRAALFSEVSQFAAYRLSVPLGEFPTRA
ncbi:MAG TPA: hypothetical protein PLC98_22510 [Anaerolineales bacterium]|nr:hypothetical protein [Anaerolineales bacterium]